MSKRARTSPPAGQPLRPALSDLPNGALSHLASYLAPPSQALLAVAMEGQEDTQTSRAILAHSDWAVLDFGSLEEGLASRLTDGMIEQILRRIDAATNLHTLKLAGCVNVVGACFAPLRGSRRLEYIDISLAGFEKHGGTLFDAYRGLQEAGCVNLWAAPLIEGRGPVATERRGTGRLVLHGRAGD